MPISKNDLEKLILEGFPNADIKLVDLAGDDDHWSVEIKDDSFSGKSRVIQHKMVYESLQGKMGGQIHALQLKTLPK